MATATDRRKLNDIDRRSQVGVALRRLREELVAHLGGDVSATESILLDEVTKKTVIVRAIGEWLMNQSTLVQDGRLLDVVLQHAVAVDARRSPRARRPQTAGAAD